jgi:hypothetical protein
MEIPSGAYTIKKKMAITKTGALKDFSQSPCLDASHIPIPISATDSNRPRMFINLMKFELLVLGGTLNIFGPYALSIISQE